MPWMRYIPKKVEPKDKRNSSFPNASVKLTGGTTGDCPNNPVKINTLNTGTIIKVPVVLAQLSLQLNVDAIVDFPVMVGEVNNIKNDIKISQCKLLPMTNKLFIKGYITQMIEYKARASIYHGKYETIDQCRVEIPFGTTTSVEYNGGEPLEAIPNDSQTFEYHNGGDVEDFIEKNKITTENFNDLPYCQLVSNKIVESYRYLNHGSNTIKVRSIKSIDEKMVVYLTIGIFQNQQIEIVPKTLHIGENKES